MGYRLRVFFALTGLLVVASLAWELLRYETHGEEREAWRTVTDTLRSQQARLDSLKGILGGLDAQLERHKRDLAAMQDRLARFERIASGGVLPAPQHREYLRVIDSHNQEVDRHNAALAEMHATYGRYSALVDTHNALIDSANAMQRRAAQAGYALPDYR